MYDLPFPPNDKLSSGGRAPSERSPQNEKRGRRLLQPFDNHHGPLGMGGEPVPRVYRHGALASAQAWDFQEGRNCRPANHDAGSGANAHR